MVKKLTSALILVDTSIFIDFFRGKTTHLDALIQENRVLLSPIVRLELIQGVRKTEFSKLEMALEGLNIISLGQNDFEQAENLINTVKGKGLNLGLPDLLLAAQAKNAGVSIYSKDRVFQELAKLHLLSEYSV